DQRFSWARDHGVTPPDYAVVPESSGWRSTPRREEAPKKTCCSKAETPKPKKSCCEHSTEDSPTCPEEQVPADESKSTTPKPKSMKVVLGIAALQCQGFGSSWTTAGLAPVPPPWTNWSPDLSPIDSLNLVPISPNPLPSVPVSPPPKA